VGNSNSADDYSHHSPLVIFKICLFIDFLASSSFIVYILLDRFHCKIGCPPCLSKSD